MIASDVMTPDPMTVNVDASVGEALDLLVSQGFRHVPVLDGREVVGMISDRDLRPLVMPKDLDEEKLERLHARLASPVSSLMSGGVITVGPEEELGSVVDLMLENQIGAVPVVDDDSCELVGIVSYVDILRA